MMFLQLFLLGFFTIATQVAIFRELIPTFSGNELSAGIFLFSWLAGSGIGNILSKKYIGKIRINIIYLTNLMLFLAIIILARGYRNILGFSMGEIVGFSSLLYFSIIFVSFYALIWGISFGMLFYNISHLYKEDFIESKIYYIEAIGAALGSLVASFIFIKLNSIFLTIGILLLILFLDLLYEQRRVNIVTIIPLLVALLLIIFSNDLNIMTEKWRMENFHIKKISESYYGKNVVIKSGKSFSFYNNGIFLFSTDDNLTPQIDISLPLSMVNRIENILVLGGNYKMIQILAKNEKVKKIYYCEPDSDLIDLQKLIIHNHYLNDRKVRILYGDIRYNLKKLNRKFDVIICSIPDPYNLLINRYYTVEFYNMLKKRMSREGIFYFKVSSSQNFINLIQAKYLGALYNSLKKVFQDILILPGDENYFLISNIPGYFTNKINNIVERAKKNNIKSDYFVRYFIPFNFDKFRINNLKNSIDYKARINSDLHPISYFYAITLWSTRFNQYIKELFITFYRTSFFIIIIIIFIIYLIFLLLIKTRNQLVVLSIGTIGFTEISLEILIILLYQITRGYLYSNIGIIFFSFMAGLAFGSFLYKKMKINRERLFYFIQLSFAFIPILLYLWYYIIYMVNVPLLQDIMFLVFLFSFSILSGVQFPIGVFLFSEKEYAGGKINGVDLLSSSVGAIFVSMFVVPIYGLTGLIILLAMINLFAFIILSIKLYKWKLAV